MRWFIDRANHIPAGLPDLAAGQTARVVKAIETGSLDPDSASSVESFRQEEIARQRETAALFEGTEWQAQINAGSSFGFELYEALRLVRQTFDELVDAAQAALSNPIPSPVKIADLHRPMMPNEQIWLDTEFKIQVREPVWPSVEFYRRFRDALEGIDATRILRCPQCPNLFWAKRRDQPTCSAVCATRRRAANFYKREPQRHRARQLYAQGYSRSKIAKRLGVDIAIVRLWVRRRKGAAK